ncbi:MAG: hypothetical protein JXR76_14705 [Deltaproteobacteria bacterium]|nr:hypothetical protein [Deltaproteobacteria bacterium]
MYAVVSDMRSEGITEALASDERLTALLEEACRVIDRVCGWYFEPRADSYRLDGHGTPSIEPPVPPIRVDSITVHGISIPVDENHLHVVGSPVQPGFNAPLLALKTGIFPYGSGAVNVDGLWGYTEPDGTTTGRTPLNIRRACMLLVLRWITPAGDVESSHDARNRWRIIEERTRDQSYKLDKPASQINLTGDPEIDALLADYRRPPGLGAA